MDGALVAPAPTKAHFGYEAMKRTMDVAAVLVLLTVLAPVLIGVALMVALTSRGPIFFTQERCGRNGRIFRIHKFRTMVADASVRAEEARAYALSKQLAIVDAPAFKSAHDPRVTPIGRLLRRFSLDELPQLFDVLRGDMSLVGPRPLVPDEAALLPPHARIRHSVKPGITCIWQTSGRSRVPYEQRVEMDMEYVRRRSMLLDIRLLLKTPAAALSADGAY